MRKGTVTIKLKCARKDVLQNKWYNIPEFRKDKTMLLDACNAVYYMTMNLA